MLALEALKPAQQREIPFGTAICVGFSSTDPLRFGIFYFPLSSD